MREIGAILHQRTKHWSHYDWYSHTVPNS